MTGPCGLELRSRESAPESAPESIPGSPPLLFVHGAMAGAWCWDENFLPWFSARGHHVFALSLRGHGASSGRESLHAFGIDDYAEDVTVVMESLPAPPVLIGHSMGGFVVQQILDGVLTPSAEGAVPQMAGAVLMAPVPPGGLLGPITSMVMWDTRLFREIAFSNLSGIHPDTVDFLQEALVSGDLPPEDIARYRDLLGPESRRAIRDMLYGGIRMRTSKNETRTPVLVLGAGEDRVIPPSYAHAAARRFGVVADILPGMAHAMMLDSGWEDCARRIDTWIRAGFPVSGD